MPTLTDIMNELAKPGRDPREQFELFTFTEGVSKMADLEVGMKLPGIVTNVAAFGAFVDIGGSPGRARAYQRAGRQVCPQSP